MADELASAIWFDDITQTEVVDPRRMSCIAAALREARALVGRDPATGMVERKGNELTWAGALVYLIYCEQIGTCFRPSSHAHKRTAEPLRDALVWFGGFDAHDAKALDALRNRLAHDYTLHGHPDGPRFALHGSASEPVVDRQGRDTGVGLPALALRIETTFNLELLTLAADGHLLCHHAGGMAGVDARFRMSFVS